MKCGIGLNVVMEDTYGIRTNRPRIGTEMANCRVLQLRMK